MFESNKMLLSYADEVVERIADRCIEVETGARNIDHIMRGTILPQLSEMILMQMGEGNMPSAVRLGVEKDGNFSIAFGDEIKPEKSKKKRSKKG